MPDFATALTHYRPLPGREGAFRSASAADRIATGTYTGLAEVPHDATLEQAAEACARVQTQTHDALVTLTTPARLTNVVWLVGQGPAGLALLDSMIADLGGATIGAGYLPEGGQAATWDDLRHVLTEHPRSVLIVATCLTDSRTTKAAQS